MKKETIQQILNFIQDSKNDFYMDHGLENENIEVLMPSYLRLLMNSKSKIIFNLKVNNHYLNNEVVVYSNKIGLTIIPAKILKF